MDTITDSDTIDTSLIWGNIRNILDLNNFHLPDKISLIDSSLGEFPVDSYEKIMLEIPKSGERNHLYGRHNWMSYSNNGEVDWKKKRIVSLPEYRIQQNLSLEDLQILQDNWNKSIVPEEIPYINLASKIKGSNSSEGRESQIIVILLVWADETARIIQLDWFEGPLDDCVTPEWYITTSPLIQSKKSFDLFYQTITKSLNLENPIYSFFMNPPLFRDRLKGIPEESKRMSWKDQWNYFDYSEYKLDIEFIIKQLKQLKT